MTINQVQNLDYHFSNINWSKVSNIIIPDEYQKISSNDHSYRTIKKSLSYSDITSEKISIEEIIQWIKKLPLGLWLNLIASISSALSLKGLNNFEVQRSLAIDFSQGPYQETIMNKVENEGFYLFIPITLASLLKMTLAYAPQDKRELKPDCIIHATLTYLALNDHVNNSIKNLMGIDDDSALKKYFIQNSKFGTIFNAFERSLRIWNLLYIYPEFVNSTNSPNEIFIKKRSIDIEMFIAISNYIFAYNNNIDFNSHESIGRYLAINTKTLFNSTTLSSEKINNFFKEQILTTEMIEKIKNQNYNDDSYFFDFSILQQYPVYEIYKDIYLPTFYPFFVQRLTDFLYWEVFDFMKSDSSHNHKIFATNFGKYLEKYIQDIFSSLYPEKIFLAKRCWLEPKVNSNDPACDILILYPNSVIFIEIKASRFKHEKTLILGKIDSIEDDLRQILYEPVEQISKSIEFFKSGGLADINLPYNGEKIYPVIITYDNLPSLEIISPLLKQSLKDKKHDPMIIDELLHIDIEEAMCLASLVFENYSIVDIINKKNTPEFVNIPFLNYVNQVYGDKSSPSKILGRDWRLFSNIIKNRLFN